MSCGLADAAGVAEVESGYFEHWRAQPRYLATTGHALPGGGVKPVSRVRLPRL
jgi:hypothetical protein